MLITFETSGECPVTLDLKALDDEMGNGSEEVLSSVIMLKVAAWAVAWEIALSEVEPGKVFIGEDEIEIGIKGNWMVEVAQLYFYIENLERYQEPNVYFAYLSGNGWEWSDFDNIDDWTDEYSQEYPDDLDDYGRDRMAESEYGLPDHLDAYFDYVKYAEDQLEGYNEYKWKGIKYLFSN